MEETISPITKPFVLLINQSMDHGNVLEEIQIAKVCPIYKNGLST